MIFWNIDKILTSIRNGTFSELDKLKYYILTSLLALMIVLQEWDFSTFTGIFEIILIMGLIIIGAFYTYNKNKSYDGLSFIERTTIFAVPLTLRLILIGIPFGIIIAIFSTKLNYIDFIDSFKFRILNTFIFSIIGIFWEGSWFIRLSQNENNEIEKNADKS